MRIDREKLIGEEARLVDPQILNAEIGDAATDVQHLTQQITVDAVQRGRRADQEDLDVVQRLVPEQTQLLIEAQAVGERGRLEPVGVVEADEQRAQADDQAGHAGDESEQKFVA